ncbi:MAG TPA: helix-turn-helix domain-containing protein [Acidimicrobiia bacterium]|nr:helix-turn-helix domain-containing protein [Acidimicrobiia bacterium]
MSERHAPGSRVLAGREAAGLSLRRAARRLGLSPRTLRGYERGREDIPFAVRQQMVTLYRMPRAQLVPDRPTAGERNAADGTIRIGSIVFHSHGADDAALAAFLSAVRHERGLAPETPMRLRSSDAELLAELLGGTPDAIVANLARLLVVGEEEAVEIGRFLLRRTAVAGALAVGVLAGVVSTGALSGGAPPAGAGEAPAGTVSTVAPPGAVDRSDPNWAVIGDAAVLYRDGVPQEEAPR